MDFKGEQDKPTDSDKGAVLTIVPSGNLDTIRFFSPSVAVGGSINGLTPENYPYRIQVRKTSPEVSREEELKMIVGAFLEPFFSLQQKGGCRLKSVIIYGSVIKNRFSRPSNDIDLIVIVDFNSIQLVDKEKLAQAEIIVQGKLTDVFWHQAATAGVMLDGDSLTAKHYVDCRIMTVEEYRRLFNLSGKENAEAIAREAKFVDSLDPSSYRSRRQGKNWLQAGISEGSLLIWGENLPDSSSGKPSVTEEDLDFLN